MRKKIASLSVCLGLAAGCASAPPPRPLVDARAAYQKARMGKAAELAPAELHTAKVSLNRAEQAYEDDAESAETYALAYVALRTVQLVESQANAKSSQRDFDQAQQEIDRMESEDMLRTRSELARAKQLLSERDKELAVKGQQIASTSAQLEAERAARAAAEEREREAMRKLAEAAALNVKEESRGTVIVLPGNVLFGSGKFELTPGAQGKLMLVAQTLVPEAESHTYLVEGHTDSRGSRDVNQELSENRARVVMDFLITQGIPASTIRSVGIGPDRPMADNNTADGRAQNRRVEIIVGRAEAK